MRSRALPGATLFVNPSRWSRSASARRAWRRYPPAPWPAPHAIPEIVGDAAMLFEPSAWSSSPRSLRIVARPMRSGGARQPRVARCGSSDWRRSRRDGRGLPQAAGSGYARSEPRAPAVRRPPRPLVHLRPRPSRAARVSCSRSPTSAAKVDEAATPGWAAPSGRLRFQAFRCARPCRPCGASWRNACRPSSEMVYAPVPPTPARRARARLRRPGTWNSSGPLAGSAAAELLTSITWRSSTSSTRAAGPSTSASARDPAAASCARPSCGSSVAAPRPRRYLQRPRRCFVVPFAARRGLYPLQPVRSTSRSWACSARCTGPPSRSRPSGSRAQSAALRHGRARAAASVAG